MAYSIHPTPTRAEMDHILRGTLSDYARLMGVMAFIYLTLMLAIFLLLPKRGPAALTSYFAGVRLATFVTAALSGAVFAFFVIFSLGYLTAAHLVTFHATTQEQALAPRSAADLWYAILSVAIVGPLVEELYFRGLMLRWLSERMPPILAAVPNALLFGAIHFRFETHVGVEGLVLTGGLVLFGLLAAFWAGRTGSIWPSFAAHATYNFTLIALPILSTR